MLGLGTAGYVFPLSAGCQEPQKPLRKKHPLMVIHQKSPIDDSLLKAAGGCPKLPTLVLLLGVTWYLSHKKGPGSLRAVTHKQNAPQGTTGHKQWNG